MRSIYPRAKADSVLDRSQRGHQPSVSCQEVGRGPVRSRYGSTAKPLQRGSAGRIRSYLARAERTKWLEAYPQAWRTCVNGYSSRSDARYWSWMPRPLQDLLAFLQLSLWIHELLSSRTRTRRILHLQKLLRVDDRYGQYLEGLTSQGVWKSPLVDLLPLHS